MNRNEEFRLLLGHCDHVFPAHSWYCKKCGIFFREVRPVANYSGDSRTVLQAMREREDWPRFYRAIKAEIHPESEIIDIGFVLNAAGRFRDRATKWMKEGE